MLKQKLYNTKKEALREQADAETEALRHKKEALRQMAEAEALVQIARAEQALKQEASEQ